MTIPSFHKKWLPLFIVLILMSIITTTFLSYHYFKNRSSNRKNESETVEVTNREQPITAGNPDQIESLNIVLLGYGGAGHQGGYLTDVIQIVNIDFTSSAIKLISIPRDLWVQLPDGNQAKVNQAFSLGTDPQKPIISGGQISKKMTSIISGLPIDYFIAVDFVGFKRLIGEDLDSITVDVPETLEDPWYPIAGEELNPCGMSPEEVAQVTQQYSGFELEKQFECRYEHLYYKQGPQQMEGGDALKYVRSRHGPQGGDFSRSGRQHAVLEGIKEKLITLEALYQLPDFYQTVTSNVTTDLDLEILQYLAPALKQATSFNTQKVIISTSNVLVASKSNSGQFILIPKAGNNQWQEVQAYILEQ